MPQLVGQHRVHLVGVQARKQCVIKHHALGRAKAGEIGVGVCTALAAVHHVKALRPKTTALHQRLHPRRKCGVFEWLKFVEPGRNPGRVDQHGQHVKAHPHAPGPKPPRRARCAHEPQHQQQERRANEQTQHHRLGQVLQPQHRRGLVKAKGFFNYKGAIQAKGNVDHRVDGDKQAHQRGLRHQPRAPLLRYEFVQGVQAAQQRPAQHYGHAPGQFQHAKTCFGHRVIGRFLVGRQRYAAGECRRHCATVLHHVADLARGQPKFEGQAAHQCRSKGECEQVGGIGNGFWHGLEFRPSATIHACLKTPPLYPNPIKISSGSIVK